jgi:TatD DNase family protein
MKIYDAHAHLQLISSSTNLSPNIGGVISCSTSELDWDQTLTISQDDNRVIPAIGIHPWFVSDIKDGWQDRLCKILESNSRAGIGECGLDLKNRPLTKTLQLDIFRSQLKISNELTRLISIHMLGGWDTFVSELKSGVLEKNRGVMHSFSGSLDIMNRCIKKNLYISFSASIFRNSNKVREIVKKCPRDYLLVESDAPSQIPIEWSEKENSPELVDRVVKRVAEIRGEDFEMISASIADNFKRLVTT